MRGPLKAPDFPSYCVPYLIKELVPFLWLPLLDMEQENTFVTQMILDLIQLFIEGMPYSRSRWAPGYLLRRLRLEMIMNHFLITTEQKKHSEGLK